MHKTPFDVFTASRHWMTGLVASGIILIADTLIGMIVKKFHHNYKFPDWKTVWKYSCLSLTVPLLVILTFFGKPPMPILLSLWILIILFCGLRLALYASSFIITNFHRSVWYFFDGLAFLPLLTILSPAIAFGLIRAAMQTTFFLVVPAVVIVGGLLWFGVMTLVYRRFKKPYPTLTDSFLSGLTTSYLLLPLLHYVGSRPGYTRYITNSENFLANALWIQLMAYLVVFGTLWLIGKWRNVEARDFSQVKKILALLVLLTIGYSLVTKLVAGKEKDIWVCQEDEWIKQGNPPYEKPFEEECGIVDKEMGL
jgi:hypothetical protein